MSKKILTKKQEKVFNLIGKYYRENKTSPTISELKEMLGVKSLRTVTQYLEILEREGFINRIKYAKRGITPINYKSYFDPTTVSVQVYGSAGCDNQSIFAETSYDETIPVSKKFIEGRKGKIIAIRAIGNSMTGAGIDNGDITLVETTDNNDVSNNERILAVVDGMAVIKRISFTKNAIVLNPDSKEESYKPIIMDKDFKIVGRIIDVIKKPKIENEDGIEIIPIKDY